MDLTNFFTTTNIPKVNINKNTGYHIVENVIFILTSYKILYLPDFNFKTSISLLPFCVIPLLIKICFKLLGASAK